MTTAAIAGHGRVRPALAAAVVAPLSRAAGWLLVPYLASVTFAGMPNLAIVRLNHPFSAS
jgi:tryptophan-rich sensory protein